MAAENLGLALDGTGRRRLDQAVGKREIDKPAARGKALHMIVLIDHLDVFKHDEKPLSQTRSPVQAGERHILLLQLANSSTVESMAFCN